MGEGADQILHINNKKINNIKNCMRKENFSFYRNCPREMLIYIVLKKSSLLLCTTNNNIVYPYLYKNFRNYGYNYSKLFKYDKRKHKKIVLETVNKSIVNIISKIGGSTDQNSLFNSLDEFKKIEREALKTSFSKIKCEHNNTELSMDTDYILKIIYLKIFEKIFLNENRNYDKDDFLYEITPENVFD